MFEKLKKKKYFMQYIHHFPNHIYLKIYATYLARCIPWNLQYCSALYQFAFNMAIDVWYE